MQAVRAITGAGGGNTIMKFIHEWRAAQSPANVTSNSPGPILATPIITLPSSAPTAAPQPEEAEISGRIDSLELRISELEGKDARNTADKEEMRSSLAELVAFISKLSEPFITHEEFAEYLRHGTPWGKERLRDEADNLARTRHMARGIPGLIDKLIKDRFLKRSKLGLTSVPKRPFHRNG